MNYLRALNRFKIFFIFFFILFWEPVDYFTAIGPERVWADTPSAADSSGNSDELFTGDDCTSFCNSVNEGTLSNPSTATPSQTASLSQLQSECLAVTGTKTAFVGDAALAIADTTAAGICDIACYNAYKGTPDATVWNERCSAAGMAQMLLGVSVQLLQNKSPLGAFLGGSVGN